jgi:diguanylate cyclase (GGDEF)-like protein
LGRVGGEEFVAVLPGATLAQARQVAERMRSAIDATRLIGPSGEVRFTVSIGVSGARIAESASALLERADAALYLAKGGGRNAVVIDEADTLARGAA